MKSSGKPTLFLCWSGHRSKQVAEAFKQYFERVFKTPGPEPLAHVAMSETLIAKGAPWSAQLLNGLENAQAGIACLTPENRGSAWLHFEGGAIATHGLTRQDGNANAAPSAHKLFSFLFTMDTPQIEGPLSLFQVTTYLRDYNRDWVELSMMTQAVLQRFEACAAGDDVRELLNDLLGNLRELHSLGFRDLLPGLEAHARRVIQALDGLSLRPGRVQAFSAILGLRRLLEDREREMEVICAPSQLMFFKRLVEVLSASSIGLEQAIAEEKESEPNTELFRKLRRILEVAVEPLIPVLDDSWRYAFYAVHERQEAYRKQKLLLIHPLESMLQRAELEEPSPGITSDTRVPAGQLLSRKEKLRALRSYWAYDRVAAYIHYCEDVSRPKEDELQTTLFELTRAVLKEISLLEVPQQEVDDLPLRFAVRALILKIKIAIGFGSFGPAGSKPVLEKSLVRNIIESRIKGETGLSFEGVGEFIGCLRKLNENVGSSSLVDLKPPLLSLIDDLERLIGNSASSARAT